MLRLVKLGMILLLASQLRTEVVWARAPIAKPQEKATPSAKQIIQDAENFRAVDRAEAKVEMTTVEGKKKNEYKMNVLQAPGRRAYLEFTAPVEENGRRMLAIKTSYWAKFPDAKRVVPISRREAIGNSAFAIADVFQMDVEGDYDPKLLGEAPCEKETCYKVQLDAKHKDAPYVRIIYYVKKIKHYPYQAEFLAASGQKLKTMTVVRSNVLGGTLRPSLLRMTDETVKDYWTLWHVKSLRPSNVVDQVFTQDYLQGR